MRIHGRCLLVASLVSGLVFCGNYDHDAVLFEQDKKLENIEFEFEHNKTMKAIDISGAEHIYLEVCKALENEDEEAFGEYVFDVDDDDFPDDDDFEPLPIATLQNLYPSPQRESGEKLIIEKIRKFIAANPGYASAIRTLTRNHVAACQHEKREALATDIAILIGKYFRAQKDIGLAQKFYHLARKSVRCEDDVVFLELGDTFLEYINNEIASTKPKHPTSEIFSALLRSIHFYSCDQGGANAFSLGDAKSMALIKHRDRMVRWPLSPTRVLNDTYYGKHVLVNKLYAKKFVDDLLADRELFSQLWKLEHFNGSEHPENIFKFLEDRGFACARGGFEGAPQYILVNRKGYIIRIKKDRKNGWHFSVGITLQNPLTWGPADTWPTQTPRSKMPQDGTKFREDANYNALLSQVARNEVAKVIVRDELLQIIPAVHPPQAPYWDEASERGLLDLAHRKIKAVGDKKKNGEVDYRGIDKFCIE